MTYFAYLDEFGHIGPYVSRLHPRFKASPVFGLAGFILPSHEVRGFGTWFFQRKCQLLEFEIKRSGQHPALWEKKGASLYTATNVTKYRQLRTFTNRLLSKIEMLGGFVFYVGVRKTAMPLEHNPNALYVGVFLEAIKRINDFCEKEGDSTNEFLLILDEHDQRSALISRFIEDVRIGRTSRGRVGRFRVLSARCLVATLGVASLASAVEAESAFRKTRAGDARRFSVDGVASHQGRVR